MHTSLKSNPASAKVIGQQRLATLARFDALRKIHGNAKAAAMVGTSVPTLWRWSNALAARGVAGLIPMAPSGGRKSPWQKLQLPQSSRRELERLVAFTGSGAAAWRLFASHPDCPPILAAYVRQHGSAPARLANFARLEPVNVRAWLSTDGGRLLIRLPNGAVVVAQVKGGQA